MASVGKIVSLGGLIITVLAGLQFQTPALQAQSPNTGYSYQSLGTLGGHDSYPSDINDFGRIAGTAETEFSEIRAFVWRRGTLTDLGTLGGDQSYGYGINDTGYVVGESSTNANQRRAFYWREGVMLDLGTLGGRVSTALDVSNGERVVGRSTTSNGATHAFMWYRGTMSDLGTLGGNYSTANEINDNKVIVGWSTNASGETRACMWKNGAIIDLGVPGVKSYAYAVNNSEQVVGMMELSDGQRHAFLWQNGVTTDLSAGLNQYSTANDINDAGTIVGFSGDDSTPLAATVWRNGTVLRMGPFSQGPNEHQTIATSINEANQIVGYDIASDDSASTTVGMLWQLEP
ncbi:HAF repeat-containing protein [Herpetosiphon gulosus]|uniref:HAF repeat-containing protein n=1 Tax=Herpetosiphon gulosus TaxID=1973496 RepID=A0ABP9X0U9_9CHLR